MASRVVRYSHAQHREQTEAEQDEIEERSEAQTEAHMSEGRCRANVRASGRLGKRTWADSNEVLPFVFNPSLPVRTPIRSERLPEAVLVPEIITLQTNLSISPIAEHAPPEGRNLCAGCALGSF
jgi:hypothetical protein